jgi:hypothetical protein
LQGIEMTQVGEAVHVAGPPGAGESDDKKKKCKLIVRVQRPTGDGPWYAFGKIGGDGEQDDFTGHTFCAHVDEGGAKKWHGFYPKGAIVGWDIVSEEDRIGGPKDFFKYVAGYLYHDDAAHPYSDEKVYEIERENYDDAEAFASKWEGKETTYSLALRNCTTFVKRDGAAAGCSLPSAGFPFANPASFGAHLK